MSFCGYDRTKNNHESMRQALRTVTFDSKTVQMVADAMSSEVEVSLGAFGTIAGQPCLAREHICYVNFFGKQSAVADAVGDCSAKADLNQLWLERLVDTYTPPNIDNLASPDFGTRGTCKVFSIGNGMARRMTSVNILRLMEG